MTDEKKQGWIGRVKYTSAIEACKYILQQKRENKVIYMNI